MRLTVDNKGEVLNLLQGMSALFRVVLEYTSNVGSGETLYKKFKDNLPWFAVYTRCHHEARVTKQLEAKNFSVLFPKYKTWSRRKDRKKIIELPLFPGYVFVQTEPSYDRFLDILRTFGVAYIVGKYGRPEPINHEEMRSLLILLSAPQKVTPHPFIKNGDRVIVVEGLFKGAIGYVLNINRKKCKLVVSIELLGRSVAVGISTDMVEKY